MKKTLLLSIIVCILAVLAYFGFQIFQKIEAKKAFTEQIKYLPKPATFQWIGKSAVTNENATIIFFFSPDCEHCQYEAKDILKQKDAFSSVNMWWVSVADSLTIKQFVKTYGLENLPNHCFASLSVEKIVQTFGSVSVPHIFIYDKHQVLQKEFKGETKVEALLKYSPQAPNGGVKNK
jgi:thioredoxin-related protein